MEERTFQQRAAMGILESNIVMGQACHIVVLPIRLVCMHIQLESISMLQSVLLSGWFQMQMQVRVEELPMAIALGRPFAPGHLATRVLVKSTLRDLAAQAARSGQGGP